MEILALLFSNDILLWIVRKVSFDFVSQNKSSTDMSLQRQLSLDLSLSDFSSVSDVVSKLQMFNLDVVAFAQENVGILLSVIIWANCAILQSNSLRFKEACSSWELHGYKRN